jgi:excisionase family DNA binding protein
MSDTNVNERGEQMAREIPQLLHWMTATDVAHELGKTRQTINKMILNGDLKTAHRLGSRLYVVKRSEVDALKNLNGNLRNEIEPNGTVGEALDDPNDDRITLLDPVDNGQPAE